MGKTPTHYQVLHVQPDAPHEIIHMSYLTLMRRLRMHPDLGGDPETAARINEAFAVLSDPEARARYDRALQVEGLPDSDVRRIGLAGPPRSPRPSPISPCEFCGTLHSARDVEQPSSACSLCGAPLYPAVLHEQDDTTRRAFHRISREWPVAFHLAYPYEAPATGTTRDVSISGMRFTTDRKLVAGQQLRLTCAFCDAVAVVRHVHASPATTNEPWSIGVAFMTLRVTLPPGGILSRVI